MRSRRILRVAQLLFGLILFAGLLHYAGPQRSMAELIRARPLPLVVTLLLVWTSTLLGAVGVSILGRALNSDLRWWDGIRGYLGAWLLGVLMLGRLGDFTLPVFWRGHLSTGQSSAVVLVDKLMTLCWLTVLGSLGFSVFFQATLGLGVLAGLAVFFGLLFVALGRPTVRSWLRRFLPSRVERLLVGFLDALRHFRRQGHRALGAAMLLTGVRMILQGAILVALLWAVGASTDLWSGILIQAVGQLGSLLPVSVMGLGILESVWLYTLQQQGIGADQVMAFSVLGRLLTIVTIGLLGMFVVRLRPGESAVGGLVGSERGAPAPADEERQPASSDGG